MFEEFLNKKVKIFFNDGVGVVFKVGILKKIVKDEAAFVISDDTTLVAIPFQRIVRIEEVK
jgi:hypothetical protein